MAEQGAHPGKVSPQQAVRLRFRNIRRQFFPFPQTVSESYVRDYQKILITRIIQRKILSKDNL